MNDTDCDQCESLCWQMNINDKHDADYCYCDEEMTPMVAMNICGHRCWQMVGWFDDYVDCDTQWTTVIRIETYTDAGKQQWTVIVNNDDVVDKPNRLQVTMNKLMMLNDGVVAD